jgi:hypothetical protein
MKQLMILSLFLTAFLTVDLAMAQSEENENQNDEELSLITNTPEEGFQVAIQLARKGVTETQSDREVLFQLREVYANDPDALIASSQVIAIHFQTVAAANNYWREEK